MDCPHFLFLVGTQPWRDTTGTLGKTCEFFFSSSLYRGPSVRTHPSLVGDDSGLPPLCREGGHTPPFVLWVGVSGHHRLTDSLPVHLCRHVLRTSESTPKGPSTHDPSRSVS